MAMTQGEAEDTLKRIQGHKGVIGVLVINGDGSPVRSTLDNSTTLHYAGQLTPIANKAKSIVRDLDPSNDLKFVRIRTRKNEILIAPAKEYNLIVIQNPSD